MPKNWKTYKLGELAEINPKVSLKQGSKYSFVEMKDLDATLKYVSPSVKKELKGGSKFQNGDTLFARITPCLENGKICQVKNLENEVGFGSTEFMIFRGKENLSDTDFIYYVTRTDYVRSAAVQAMTGTSGRQRVEKSALQGLKVVAPDLKSQKQIASILSSLDNKMELNLQVNQTLEAMAQAIFKEWFVNFNFPGFDGKLVDGLPKGWGMGTLNDVCSNARKTYNPKSGQLDSAYVGLEHIPKKSISLWNWGHSSEIDSQKSVFNKGDILFGKLRPYFHKVVIAPIDGICSTDILVIRGNEQFMQFFSMMHLSSDDCIQYANSHSDGTRMPRVNWDSMSKYSIVIPSGEVLKLFDQIMTPLIERIYANIFESITLTQIRDSLLPNLMTGKLEVKHELHQ